MSDKYLSSIRYPYRNVLLFSGNAVCILNQLHTDLYWHTLVSNMASINSFNIFNCWFMVSTLFQRLSVNIHGFLFSQMPKMGRYFMREKNTLCFTDSRTEVQKIKVWRSWCNATNLPFQFSAVKIRYPNNGEPQRPNVEEHHAARKWIYRKLSYARYCLRCVESFWNLHLLQLVEGNLKQTVPFILCNPHPTRLF